MSRRRHLYTFGPHELPCGDGARLIIARTREGDWEAVYYQPRFDGDPIGARFAITKRVLLDAVRVLFAEAGEPFDADELISWIRSQSWGAGLPALTARRPAYPMPQDERLAEAHGYDPGPEAEGGRLFS